jgi:hypothetical protein
MAVAGHSLMMTDSGRWTVSASSTALGRFLLQGIAVM